MKMETAKIEYEIFDCADVITTSGGGDPIPDTLTMIWLSAESVNNYNAYFPTGDIDLSTGGDWEGYKFLAYDGTIIDSKIQKYGCNKGQDVEPPKENLFVVSSSTDSVGYDRVLKWLQSRQ